MRFWRRYDPWILAAYAVLTTALLLFTVIAGNAWQITPIKDLDFSMHNSSSSAYSSELAQSESVGDSSIVRRTVMAALFRPDRTPPAEPYVPPSKRRDRSTDRENTQSSELRLVGTAVLSNGRTMAAFQLPEGAPVLAEKGTVIQGLRVVDVEDGQAILVGRDSTFVFGVEPPSEDM